MELVSADDIECSGSLSTDIHDVGGAPAGKKYQIVSNEEFTLGPQPRTDPIPEGEDLEQGQASNEELTMMDWAETIAVIDMGCWVRVKNGTAGQTPEEDSFPWLTHSKMTYLRMLWDLSPSDYRLVSFPHMPKDAYDPEEYLHAHQIMLSDVTEVMLEVAPSPSFRLYLSNQVIQLTPLPENRDHAAAWVDAIFAVLQLQNMEEELQARRKDVDARHAADNEDLDALQVDEDMLAADEEQIRDLRLRFYVEHQDLINKFTFGKLDPDDATDPASSSVMVIKHEEALGHNSIRMSARLDLTQIYEQAHNMKKRDEEYNSCCIST